MTTTAAEPWPAPTRAEPVSATVTVPGSKSVTNRALILASLATGPSTLRGALAARDTDLMLAALRALGVRIGSEADVLTIEPGPMRGPADVQCGLAGTVMRFVPPVAALATGAVRFDGDPEARRRPMAQILDALRALGVAVDPADSLPFTVRGTGSVAGGVVTIDASASSQFVSALLLAGCRYDAGVDLRHDGKAVPSQPHIDMTIAMLRERGVEVDDAEPHRWVVRPSSVRPLETVIEPDLSNAAPFLAAAVVTGGRVTVSGWPDATTQPGDRLREILPLFGASVTHGAAGLTVTGGGPISGVDLDLHDVGELTPVLAAVCALADGPSHLRGIAHLRGHETDRLAALATELHALGCDIRETEDGLRIAPRPLHGGVFGTYHDHRMAQAAAVLGLRVPGIAIENVATTAKTYPEFTAAWGAIAG